MKVVSVCLDFRPSCRGPAKFAYSCLDEKAKPQSIEASGWNARMLQHEIDHLQGTLYVDRMDSRTFTSLDNWGRFWKGKQVREVIKESARTSALR